MKTYKISITDREGKARNTFLLQTENAENLNLILSKELVKSSFDATKEQVKVLEVTNVKERLSVKEAEIILKEKNHES